MGTHHFDLQYFDCNADLKQRINVLTPRNADLLALALELRRGLEFAKKHARIDCAMMSDGEAMGWGTVDNLLARASALLDKDPRHE